MPRKIDTYSWNAALDAAAELLGNGYYWVRRPYDPKSRSFKIEVSPINKKPRGTCLELCHVSADEEGKDVAAIHSLRRED